MSNIFHRIKRSIRFFFQRMFRGFDDSETWDLNCEFYKWLLPRLKRFSEITIACPIEYKSMKRWKKELNKRIKQLEEIVEADGDIYNVDFIEWFANNLGNLWW